MLHVPEGLPRRETVSVRRLDDLREITAQVVKLDVEGAEFLFF